MRSVLVLLVACAATAGQPSPPAGRAQRTRTLLLTVRDAGGPVAGATITYEERTTRTDAYGRATLSGLHHREQLAIRAPGHATQELTFERDDPAATVVRDVTLVPGALIEGIVLDEHGVPSANHTVHLATGDVEQQTESDATGHWRFVEVAAGHHHVDDQDVDSDGIHPASVVLQMPGSGTISGRVIDGIDRGVAGARVFCETKSAVTDANGRFSISISRGRYQLYAVTATSASPDGLVSVAANEHVSVDLVLAESSLAGTVVDSAGRPVVAHISASAPYGSVSVSTDSDAAGHFDLGGVPPGSYFVSARLDSGPRSSFVESKTGDRDVVLAIPEAGAVVGRVLFRGTPVPAFGIALSGSLAPVYTSDGRFAQHDIDPGPTDVTIVASGFVPRHFAFTVAAGSTIDLGNIELSRGRTLRGRVVDTRGFAVAHAIVRLSYDFNFDNDRQDLQAIWRGHLRAETDVDGNFAIRGVDPASTGLLEARDGELRSRRRSLDEDLLIVEPTTGGITVDIALPISDQWRVSAGDYLGGPDLPRAPLRQRNDLE